MPNFEYRGWACWGIGSTATFGEDRGWDHRFTLRSLTSKTAVVGVEQIVDDSSPAKPLGRPSELILHADPEAAVLATRRPEGRTPLEKIVRPGKEPQPLPPQVVVEGNEILDVAGEEFLCRWVERQISENGLEYAIKTWEFERVPGGIVRVELKFLPLVGTPARWFLKSFEGKKG
jgi:hypothetical protein